MSTRKAIVAAVVAGALSLTGTVSASAFDSTETRKRKCTPGYRPCIPTCRCDVDCYGGGGNGLGTRSPGVVYRVWGRNRYALDADPTARDAKRAKGTLGPD